MMNTYYPATFTPKNKTIETPNNIDANSLPHSSGPTQIPVSQYRGPSLQSLARRFTSASQIRQKTHARNSESIKALNLLAAASSAPSKETLGTCLENLNKRREDLWGKIQKLNTQIRELINAEPKWYKSHIGAYILKDQAENTYAKHGGLLGETQSLNKAHKLLCQLPVDYKFSDIAKLLGKLVKHNQDADKSLKDAYDAFYSALSEQCRIFNQKHGSVEVVETALKYRGFSPDHKLSEILRRSYARETKQERFVTLTATIVPFTPNCVIYNRGANGDHLVVHYSVNGGYNLTYYGSVPHAFSYESIILWNDWSCLPVEETTNGQLLSSGRLYLSGLIGKNLATCRHKLSQLLSLIDVVDELALRAPRISTLEITRPQYVCETDLITAALNGKRLGIYRLRPDSLEGKYEQTFLSTLEPTSERNCILVGGIDTTIGTPGI
jgi:hypothetical protein